jgi:L-serine dehydratase
MRVKNMPSKLFYPDFFNDVFGPIMQPGSSGGFAGPCRIGNIARSLVKAPPKKVRFLFSSENRELAQLVNFMSDRAFLGGIQGFQTDDVRLFDAHALARQNGISYDFDNLATKSKHPGSVQIEIEGNNGELGLLVAASIGGGMIKTYQINGFDIEWQSDTYGILIEIGNHPITSAQVKEFEKAFEPYHINTLLLKREDGVSGYFFEISKYLEEQEVSQYFRQSKIILLPALLPVVTTKNRRPQLFKTVEEWRQTAKEKKISFVQAAIEYEKAFSGWSDKQIWDYFEIIADILYKQIHSLEEIGYENAKDTSLLPIYGKQWNQYIQKKSKISDTLTNHILIHAFSTNAKLPGVRIVPGPMGTGGGYLFSALDAVREERGYSHKKLVESLAVAAALGALAYTHTNASGEVGCVGESGVCCAMASGAVTWLAGGDGVQVEHAASMALQANIGIPCDPIAGGLEFPCITRTLRAAVTAPLYADLALSGIDPLIPYHEVLQAIEHNFRNTDIRFLSGSNSGCNCTKTAQCCLQTLKQDSVFNLHYHVD